MSCFAICASPTCDFRIELHDPRNGTKIATPKACPACLAPVISTCPWCGFLLFKDSVVGPRPRCAVCRREIRRASGSCAM